MAIDYLIDTVVYSLDSKRLCHTTEEIMHMTYILRCLGVPITQRNSLLGDNLCLIQNASNPDSFMKKKHAAISFHTVHEAIASSILVPN